MPSRILRDTYATSDTIAGLPDGPQDRFPRYLLAADDFGCVRYDPVVLKALLFCKRASVTPETVRDDVTAYEAAGLIVFWRVEDKVYGFFRGWFDNQNKPRGLSKRKTCPPPENLKKSNVLAISAIRCNDAQEHKEAPGKQVVHNRTATTSPDFAGLGRDGCAMAQKTNDFAISAIDAPQYAPQSQSQSQSQSQEDLPIASQSGNGQAVAPSKRKRTVAEKTTDPRHAPLVAHFVARWEGVYGSKYEFHGGRDAKAVTRLLALGDDAEIHRRFEIALGDPFFRKRGLIEQLVDGWNGYATAPSLRGTGPPGRAGPLPPAPPSAYEGKPSGF